MHRAGRLYNHSDVFTLHAIPGFFVGSSMVYKRGQTKTYSAKAESGDVIQRITVCVTCVKRK